MSTLTKHQEFLVTNVEEFTSIKHLSSEKLPESSQEQVNQGTYPSLYSAVEHARMLTQNSFLEKFNPWTKYDGLHIYDMEDDE